MTNQHHPITPPPELVEEWANHSASVHRENGTYEHHELAIATQAARWGADQELEACCDWVSWWRCMVGGNRPEIGLRAFRRPEPPSLKEQALKMLRPLNNPVMPGTPEYRLYEPQADIIRRALESLPD